MENQLLQYVHGQTKDLVPSEHRAPTQLIRHLRRLGHEIAELDEAELNFNSQYNRKNKTLSDIEEEAIDCLISISNILWFCPETHREKISKFHPIAIDDLVTAIVLISHGQSTCMMQMHCNPQYAYNSEELWMSLHLMACHFVAIAYSARGATFDELKTIIDTKIGKWNKYVSSMMETGQVDYAV